MKSKNNIYKGSVFLSLIVLFTFVITNILYAQSPKYGGTIKAVMTNSPPHLDPFSTTSHETGMIMWHVYEGLFEFTKDLELKPHLAKGYTVSDGGLRYNIELRQGVLFHDGTEMTSEDVLASLDRWFKVNEAGREVAPNVKKVGANGKYGVIVELQKPYGPFLGLTASFVSNQKLTVFKEEIVRKFGDKVITEHIGTGPYKFSKWIPNQSIELVRFENYAPAPGPGSYYAGKRVAYLDKISYDFVVEEATRVVGVESGQYDYTREAPLDEYNIFMAKPNLRPYLIEGDSQLLVIFNKFKGRLFSNVNARRAIAAAVDSEEILGSAYGSPKFWRLNPSMGAKGTVWYNEKGKEKYNVHDIEKAKTLLAKSGYDGRPVKLIGDLLPRTRGASMAIKEQLKKIGIEVQLDLLEKASLGDVRKGKDWDIYVAAFNMPHPFPDVWGAWVGTNKWVGFWDDEDSRKMDALWNELSSTTDHGKRVKIFETIQEFYWDVNPYVTIGDGGRLDLLSKRMKGFEATPFPGFWNVWLEE